MLKIIIGLLIFLVFNSIAIFRIVLEDRPTIHTDHTCSIVYHSGSMYHIDIDTLRSTSKMPGFGHCSYIDGIIIIQK